MTPFKARFLVAAVLMLAAGVAVNALLLQGWDASALHTPATVRGASKAARVAPANATASAPLAASARTDIKTAGLPAQPNALEAELKFWQARLRQLEAEAKGAAPTTHGATTQASVNPLLRGPQGPVVAPLPAPLASPLQGSEATQADAPASPPKAATSDDALTPVTTHTVRAIQRELSTRGYEPGPVDGNIGLMTRAAIMAFEHDEGMLLSGEPSEALLRHIILGATAEDAFPQPGQKSRENAERLIRSVQQALASMNYVPCKVDGALNEETTRAIREFEMDQGLQPTGRVSGRLIVRLARQAGKAFSVPLP